jgi:hypothetical protein
MTSLGFGFSNTLSGNNVADSFVQLDAAQHRMTQEATLAPLADAYDMEGTLTAGYLRS